MIIEKSLLQSIIESALMAYGQPLTIEKLQSLFVEDKTHDEKPSVKVQSQVPANEEEGTESAPQKVIDPNEVPSKQAITEALESIAQSCEERGFELKKVSSGWRFQVKADMAKWVNRLWEEKPQRYSRALLETLSIIAYRQPITRGDIEEIRGVAVSSHIIKTLSEREWVKVVGHRDVPGRPSLFATTRQFLDYFNLESLEELPSLRELADIDSLNPELDLQAVVNKTDSDNETDDNALEEGQKSEGAVESLFENNEEALESDEVLNSDQEPVDDLANSEELTIEQDTADAAETSTDFDEDTISDTASRSES